MTRYDGDRGKCDLDVCNCPTPGEPEDETPAAMRIITDRLRAEIRAIKREAREARERAETLARGAPMSDEDRDLLIRCDSLLSLIRHREGPLTEQTRRDLDDLLPVLRARTDELIHGRNPRASATDPGSARREWDESRDGPKPTGPYCATDPGSRNG